MSETGSVPEFDKSMARLQESWLALFRTGLPAGAGTSPDFAADLAQMQQRMFGVAAAFTEPMRKFAESQQELSQQISRWAESQRDLAEIAAAWADSQRKLADTLSAWTGSPPAG